MRLKTYIRKEFKSRWEGRTPLTPKGVRKLGEQGIPIHVERSDIRAYKDSEYADAGAVLVDQCQGAQVVLGIKEPAVDAIEDQQVHLAFSHTIKGQAYNMDLLQRFIDKKATLIDYEIMKDDDGVRVIAFGRYAGIAGAVDTFHVAGQKFAMKSRNTVLDQVQQTWRYRTIESLEKALSKLRPGADDNLGIVIVGTGNVGKGSEEVCQWMGIPKITPEQLLADQRLAGSWYCVLETQDVVRRKDGGAYDREEYREHGIDRYESDFERFLGKFDILLQTPYWTEKYPYQMPRELFQRRKADIPPVIGDISCDIHGSLACTFKESSIDVPAFTYNIDSHSIEDGISWDGPIVMSIGHLPCELSLSASRHFSSILTDFVPEIVKMDLSKPLETCGLGRLLREATIVYNGKLTPEYAYLQECLDDYHAARVH